MTDSLQVHTYDTQVTSEVLTYNRELTSLYLWDSLQIHTYDRQLTSLYI